MSSIYWLCNFIVWSIVYARFKMMLMRVSCWQVEDTYARHLMLLICKVMPTRLTSHKQHNTDTNSQTPTVLTLPAFKIGDLFSGWTQRAIDCDESPV